MNWLDVIVDDEMEWKDGIIINYKKRKIIIM